MQIDGHHTLTYIAARCAGLNSEDAQIVAYSAQYVDDATNSGVLNFSNGAKYKRISSAHKIFDYRNSDELANQQVWLPFHFLPGNAGLAAGQNPEGSFINKLISTPDSFVARDMLSLTVVNKAKPYALHRLGITMHVYADTFAHQGFIGQVHQVNSVDNIESDDGMSWMEKAKSKAVSSGFPLGHGAALSLPDRPYINWKYTDSKGEVIERNNTAIFIEATDKMCRAIRCFSEGREDMNLDSVQGISSIDAAKIESLLKSINYSDGEERHAAWLQEIRIGSFSFGADNIEYIAKGEGSWKHASIGQLAIEDSDGEEFTYAPDFLQSNWKLFHDALQAHRFDILHDVLPKYGICAA